MGGPGSGGFGGRKLGGRNTDEARSNVAAGLRAAREIKAKKPRHCQGCGAEANVGNPLEWFGAPDEDGVRVRRWVCATCLLGELPPLRIEDFALTGTSNMAEAQGREMPSSHHRGPGGDAARRGGM